MNPEKRPNTTRCNTQPQMQEKAVLSLLLPPSRPLGGRGWIFIFNYVGGEGF